MEEIWKDIKGYEGSYMISNLGRARSIDRIIIRSDGVERTIKGGILKQHNNKAGYPSFGVWKDNKRVLLMTHRIVLSEFVQNNDKTLVVNHKDGDKENNLLSNLEWCTQKFNIDHAMNNGLFDNRGIKHGNSKISESDVLKIRKLHKDGLNHQEIADKIGVKRRNVTSIVNRKTWKHI